MKRAGICLWMMIKRMGKHPVYWMLLLLFPAAVFTVPQLDRAAADERIGIGYVIEEAGPGQGDEGREQYYDRQLFVLLESKLAEDTGGMFQYTGYPDAEKLKEDVKTGEIAGGVVFDHKFPEKLWGQDYYHCIGLYLPEGMNVGGIVQEDVFQRVYQAYSAVWYAKQLEQRGHQIKPEKVMQKFSEYQNAGKVYAVNYELQDESGDHIQNVLEGEKRDSVLSLRSVLAFLTLLSASLGALDAGRDKRRNMGRGISHPTALAAAAAGAPILAAVLFLAAGMLSVNMQMTGMSYVTGQTAGFLQELGSAAVYGLVLWLFAMLAAGVLPQKFLEGMMPCFLLTVLLCCPVFLELGEMMPIAAYVSRLFPLTWYLRFWAVSG